MALDVAPAAAELDEAGFREALRSFLRAHHPGRPPRGGAGRLEHERAWAATLADRGWAAPAWPRRWGGMDLPAARQIIYHREMALARVPSHPSPNAFIVGAALLRYGTEAQRERFLRPIVRGGELWAQGFSEPDAGSDLPSLRTRAVCDGDEYVVTGHKVWTTRAQMADWMFTLVRTGPPGSRQDGITYLLVDLDSPGITVRPLRDMTGGMAFGEVVLDDVRVPVTHRVGQENGGWAVTRTSLGAERSTTRVAHAVRYRRVLDDLIGHARDRGVTADPLVRQNLARLEIDVRLLELTFGRVAALVVDGHEPGPAASVARLFLARFEQRLHEVALDITGADGLLAASAPDAPERGRWAYGFLKTRASTIGAGTAEIQRTTIGEQTLGLPREPSPG
ncbi:MAG: acyl-CoA dehydrogenase family protein [Actinobacteria bacterium]|nr:acyl-CoA dehydrogenase family protein [Actinomycetota bacterium]